MKIFLTGGTGFVGSHLLNQLHRTGCEVVALKRPGSSLRIPLHTQPEWVEAEMDKLHNGVFAGCDALIHLAAHSPNVPYDSLDKCLYWNLGVSLDLIRQAAAEGVSRFLVAGSCFEYGKSGERYEHIPTNAPLEPTDTYPISKAAASIAIMGLARSDQLSLSYHRIFQVYGEGEAAGRLWPSLRKAALAGEDFPMSAGEQVRDFTPVEAVAEHFIGALKEPAPLPGKPCVRHVGAGRPMTTIEFAEHWWNIWEAKGRLQPGALPYRTNEIMRYVPKLD